tara:strand:+ start:741 stop:1262 length:522 start_codon:yes stop_codon:yes gene_type:complete
MICAICYDNIKQPKRLACNHTYCRTCIAKWCKINNKCPVCRLDITNKHNYNLRSRHIRSRQVEETGIDHFQERLHQFDYSNIKTRSEIKWYRLLLFKEECRALLKSIEIEKQRGARIEVQKLLVDKLFNLVYHYKLLLPNRLMIVVRDKLNELYQDERQIVKHLVEKWRPFMN